MIKKKKIAVIALASVMTMSLCVATTSVFAANNDGLKKIVAVQKVAVKQLSDKSTVKGAQTHDDLVAIAAKFEINIEGMTDEQIETALVAYKQSHQKIIINKTDGPASHEDLVAIATKLGIDTAGMTDEQIEKALVAYKQSHQEKTITDGLPPHEHLIAIAQEVGINVDGMTDEQIEAALVAYKQSHRFDDAKPADLQLIAKKMGIDTTGMTDDQIKSAISEKGKMADYKK